MFKVDYNPDVLSCLENIQIAKTLMMNKEMFYLIKLNILERMENVSIVVSAKWNLTEVTILKLTLTNLYTPINQRRYLI